METCWNLMIVCVVFSFSVGPSAIGVSLGSGNVREFSRSGEERAPISPNERRRRKSQPISARLDQSHSRDWPKRKSDWTRPISAWNKENNENAAARTPPRENRENFGILKRPGIEKDNWWPWVRPYHNCCLWKLDHLYVNNLVKVGIVFYKFNIQIYDVNQAPKRLKF